METLLTLFVFGGFWFWSLVVVASLLFIALFENERGGWATLLLLTTVAIIIGLSNQDWLVWIVANPITILLYALGYLTVGIIWGTMKWWLHVRTIAVRYRNAKRKWIVKEYKIRDKSNPNYQAYRVANDTGKMTKIVKEAWLQYFDRYWGPSIKKPVAADNKSLITGWMTYWPWSALWTLINDPVRKFFNWVYESISDLLQNISDKVFKDIDNELKDE